MFLRRPVWGTLDNKPAMPSLSLFHWENGKRRQKYEGPEKRGESLGEAMINLRVLVFFLAASFSSQQSSRAA